MSQLTPMVIGGERVPALSGETFEIENPATGKTIASVPMGREEDVDRAVASARAASPQWSQQSAQERAEVLNRCAEILARNLSAFVEIEVAQTGRPIREMRAQLARLPEWYSYFAAVARTYEEQVHPFGGDYLNYNKRTPLGVVGLITPWNHPLLILTKKLAPALAAGNAVVVKPSELAPLTSLMLADVFDEAGLPPGIFNVVCGFGADAGSALSGHRGIDRVDLTGGTKTGRVVAATAGGNLIPVTAELGGKAPVLIFDDIALEEAVAGAMFAAFIASGQTCVQGARLIVQDNIHDAVVKRLAERANAIRVGDPTQAATQLGSMVSEAQLKTVEKYVAMGKREGATLVAGGKRLTEGDLAAGNYYAPTVFVDMTPDMTIARDEIFGPVVGVMKFHDEAEALELANDSVFGLAASVWTKDLARAHRVAKAVEAGIVWINDHHRIDPASPWGGFKQSGLGKENGIVAYEANTKLQSVIVNLSEQPFDWFADDVSDMRYS